MKLTDFGIGQVVSEEVLAGVTRAGFTQTILADSSSSKTGTQLYMAPELLAGKPASTRSDIYSLGVVLYQLLVGDFSRPVTTDWAKQIEEPLLREDLALCFAGKPEERFAGAGQLAKNLRALPQRQAARATEAAEQASRERAAYRRGVVRTAAMAVLLVVGFAGLASYAIQQADRAGRTARAEAYQRYSAEMNLAQQAYHEGRVARALSLLTNHIPVSANQEDLRGFEWRYLWRLCQKGDALHTFDSFSNAVAAVAFSGDGNLVACDTGGGVRVLDMAAKHETAGFHLSDKAVDTIAVSANGEVLAAVDSTNAVRVWRISGKQGPVVVPENGPFNRLALSPDGKILAIACPDRIRVWDWAEQRQIAEFPWRETGLSALAFSPEGRLLAGGALPLRFWNIAEKRELEAIMEPHTGVVGAMAFSADGRTLATAAWDTTLKLWDLPSRQPLAMLPGHGSFIKSLAFSPDGRTLASAGSDGTVKLWDVSVRTNAKLRAALRGHQAAVTSVAFSSDGKLIASGSADRTVKLWSVVSATSSDLLAGHTGWVWSVDFSPDGQILASASLDGSIRFWDPRTSASKTTIQVAPLDVFTVAFSPDGKLLASSEGMWRGWRWGQTSAPAPAKVKLWSVGNPQKFTPLPGNTDWPRTLGFSPDGKILASGDHGGSVKLWALPAGTELATFRAHAGWIHALRFSPDGKTLATGSMDHTVKLWNFATRQEVATLEGHTGAVSGLAFSADGTILASSSDDYTIRLWRAILPAEALKGRGTKTP